jgi:hypothetical protein
MRWTSPLLAFLALLAATANRPDPARADKAPPKNLSVGLSDREVQLLIGHPGRKSRQVLLHRLVEQWHYGAPLHVRLTFDCERGQRPILKRIDQLPLPDR